MAGSNVTVSFLSLNVCGLRNYFKRKKIFKYLHDKHPDVIFLQETHSTKDVELFWKRQMKGHFYFSHGNNLARGVLTFIREGLDFELLESKIDTIGRYVILKIKAYDKMFTLANIYAPNIVREQNEFWRELCTSLNNVDGIHESIIIAGGDFNVSLNVNLDRVGRDLNCQSSTSSRLELSNLLNQFELCDIWRFYNPRVRQYTWRKRDFSSQSRLDYWFVPFDCQDFVSNVNIIPSVSTDHSAILLHLELKDQKFGKGYWKFNSSLCSDNSFCNSLKENFSEWKIEAETFNPISRWDYLKFKIRRFSQKYSKMKAKTERSKRIELEKKLQNLEQIGYEMDDNKKEEYEQVKQSLDEYYNKVTDGLIIRSKSNWVEYGEKSNKYFLTLEKQRKNKSSIKKLIVGDKCVENETEILDQIKLFYKSLYSKQPIELKDRNALDFLNTNGLCLSRESKLLCEGKLTKEECYKALFAMPSGKSPGNDGLTKEFYLHFWDLIAEALLSSLNYSYDTTELSNSQKQSVITLILKPNKDKRNIQNYRPISLLNVDAKICSKALASRVKRVLDEIIHPDQHAFLKGRSISEAIRNIHDMFHYLDKEQKEGYIVSVDFLKAFDSIDHDFIYCTLEAFGFGPSFIRWVKTLYSNIEGCVLNNGISTGYFQIKRGVRQGDPLSPYLFILALETLAIRLRSSEDITGININNSEFRLSLYADDFCSFCLDTRSINKLFHILEQFHKCSSLRFNKDKTEILTVKHSTPALKDNFKKDINYTVNVVDTIKILGTFVGQNAKQLQNERLTELICGLQKTLNLWKSRKLTLLGKIQILKTFGISKFTYLFSSVVIPSRIIEEIEKILYSYLWDGPDRVKRNVIIQELIKGGLKMIDVKSFITAQQLIWIDKIVPENTQVWYQVLKYYLRKNGGLFLFNCNYEIENLSSDVPDFYSSLLEKWFSICNSIEKQPFRSRIIWNNRDIKIDKQTMFYSKLFDKGIYHIHQIITPDGRYEDFQLLKEKFDIDGSDYLRLRGIYCAAKRNIEEYLAMNINEEYEQIVNYRIITPHCLQLIPHLKSRHFYKILIESKYEKPISTFRMQLKFDMTEEDIAKARKLVIQTSLDSKLREFQFKILNNILPLNYKLFKMKLIISPYCTFGCSQNETVEHIMWTCRVTQEFWRNLIGLLHHFDFSFLNERSVITGIVGKHKYRMLLNQILLIAKKCIYVNRCKGTRPSLSLFKSQLINTYKEEVYISKRRGKFIVHTQKWEPLMNFITSNSSIEN